jgi:hypothetical protein
MGRWVSFVMIFMLAACGGKDSGGTYEGDCAAVCTGAACGQISSCNCGPCAESDSQSEPDVATASDAAGSDDATLADAPIPDLMSDASADVPDVEMAKNCWEVFECIISDEMAWDLAEYSFLQCGAILENGKYDTTVQELHDCLDVCMITDSDEEFASCLTTNCIDSTLSCMGESTDGSKNCAQANRCSIVDCTVYDGQPLATSLSCLLGCYAGMDTAEIDKLTEVVDQCAFEGWDSNPACLPALRHCYAGSGDAGKSCWEMIACDQSCGLCDDCQVEACLAKCYLGMSWEAYDQTVGLTLCYRDESADPFVCLDYALQCFEESLGSQPGTTSCAQTLQAMKGSYYAPATVPFEDKFGGMLETFWALNKEYISTMFGTLECLSHKWEIFPGYGVMGQPHWAECAQNCP